MAKKQIKDKNSKINRPRPGRDIREARQRKAIQIVFALFSIILILSLLLSMLITN